MDDATRQDNHCPQWFRWAMQPPAEQAFVEVEGARIEWAAWGERGRPGVLLLTGNGAHIGWWRPIARFLARDYRVATMSWSGMGRSDWRDRYTPDLLLREAGRVGEVAGLFDAVALPVMVAHSFGGFLAIRAAASWAGRLRGVVFVDSRLRPRRVWGDNAAPVSPSNIYKTREDAVGRFRLQPPQPEANRFYLDMLAEEALVEVAGGWTWRSDPAMRNKIDLGGDLMALVGQARCPLAFIRGEKSTSVTDEIWAELKQAAPSHTPFLDIPEAYHHVMVDQPLALVTGLRAVLEGIRC
jgi:pimeloyl-ACP methyl ester carboxylesterase